MKLLAPDFQVFAVDLRGQGRSTRTPGPYTLDNMANDLVRFVNFVIKRSVIVSGCSSGGVLSAWMSAYAPPGMVRGSHYEDPPLFSSELTPPFGPGIRQTEPGQNLARMARFLGDQWSIGDRAGFQRASAGGRAVSATNPVSSEPPQNMKEYDPEWGSFYDGTVAQSCHHQQMLRKVKVPVLFTHHRRAVDPNTGMLSGAISDFQAQKVKELVEGAGQKFEDVSLPDAAHSMHRRGSAAVRRRSGPGRSSFRPSVRAFLRGSPVLHNRQEITRLSDARLARRDTQRGLLPYNSARRKGETIHGIRESLHRHCLHTVGRRHTGRNAVAIG